MDDNLSTNPMDDFARENRKLWETFDKRLKRTSDKCILVDLLVSHPGYFIGNATIAKYMQSFLGCEVVGVVPSQNVPGFAALAKSFGIDRVVPEPDFNKPVGNMPPVVGQALDFLRGGDLKQRLLKIRFDDIEVGDLIYDSYLRETGRSEVAAIDPELAKIIYMACAYFTHYSQVMQELDVVATVQGHVVYNRFGILARLALKNGATVFGKKYAESPFTVRRYRTLDDARTYEFTFTPEEFDALWRDRRDLAVEGGRQYLSERFAAKNADRDVMQAFAPDKKFYDRGELSETLGLPADRFTVFVMSHVFCDLPHGNGWLLHADFHEWLVDTVERAIANDRVNWVIKPHPSEYLYPNAVTATQVIADLVKDVPHVAIAPDDLNTAALTDLADAVVTAVGTAAVELPALGIPAVIAGQGAFSELGIAAEPKTLDEYRQILATIDELAKPTPEQIERALAYVYFSFKLCRVDCPLIPPTDQALSDAYHRNFMSYWGRAAELARTFGGFDDDRLYQNFRRQFESDADHLLNFDWLEADGDAEPRISAGGGR